MTQVHDTIARVTRRIAERSRKSRAAYLDGVREAREAGPRLPHLACGNIAHAFASSPGKDKNAQIEGTSGNLAIITAYNDMLSAHKPYENYPEIIRSAVRQAGGTAQVAAGVPAMCDGVTQGQPGMELSLFSRDVIALASAIGLSHNVFDGAIFLGICDKIVPGMLIAATTFGHLPAMFIPAGPMPSGMPNDRKAKIREEYAAGKCGRETLLSAEMASYHGPGTCTFYGTANTNQMLMEFMGLQLPGSSFVNPGGSLRRALTEASSRRALENSRHDGNHTPICDVLDERAFVNGIVGLHATGGSTNLLIHLVAVGRAAGIVLEMDDFSEISSVTPLLCRMYPNGLLDINHFHAAGGLGFVIGELLDTGRLHPDTRTVAGSGLEAYTREPALIDGKLAWRDRASESLSLDVLRPMRDPFIQSGGLKCLSGSLGSAVMKVSAIPEDRLSITAPARVFHDQEGVGKAFRQGELDKDVIVVVRFQGPKSNGMPELHGLTPMLASLQSRGFRVALVTDGRMSGASGKVPAAIHVTPEAFVGGPIARISDGDILCVDAVEGRIEFGDPTTRARVSSLKPAHPPEIDHRGSGRSLFQLFRQNVRPACDGAGVI